jgi:hypothetical protein
MVVMFVDCCVGCYGTFGIIPTVGILWGMRFLILPEPLSVNLFNGSGGHQNSCSETFFSPNSPR